MTAQAPLRAYRSSLALLAFAAAALGDPGAARAESTTAPRAESSAETAPALASPELELSLSPAADAAWTMVLRNAGKTPVRVLADGRLLWLEIVPPPELPSASRHARPRAARGHAPGHLPICRMPAEMRSPTEQEERALILKPGERYEEKIDPVALCGASRLAAELRDGAVVYPHLGFPDPDRRRPARPAKGAAPLPPPPYVADSLREPRDVLPLRHLDAVPFILWHPAEPPPDAKRAADPSMPPEPLVDERAARLELAAEARADALRGPDVTVRVTAVNAGKRAALVHLRPDDVLFSVDAPHGVTVHCNIGSETRSPARDFFESWRPGTRRSLTIRLAEACPPDSFDRPGVYRAHARLLLRDGGREYQLSALVASASAPAPTAIRVRTGRLPYFIAKPEALPAAGSDAPLRGLAPAAPRAQ